MKTKNSIGWFMTLIVAMIIMMIPTSNHFPHVIKLFFVITISVIIIIAFELLPRFISALLLPILYCATELVSPQIAFSSWLTPTVGIVLGGLLFCTILSECGIFKRIAYRMILLFGGTYQGAVIGCFIIGIVLNMITFCNAWLVAGGLVFGVCQAMELKPSKESALLCFAGIVGASGPTVFLYYPGYYMILENCVRYFIPNYHMHMFTTFVYNGLGLLIFGLLIVAMLKFMHLDLSEVKHGKKLFEKKYEDLGPLSQNERYAFVGIVTLILYLFSTTFTKWPVLYGFVVVPAVLLLATLNMGSLKVLKKIDYSIVVFISSCLGIGIVGKEIGFDTFILQVSEPYLVNASPLTILCILLCCGIISNFFMTPYAMLGGLSIPFVEIGLSMQLQPLCVLMTLLWSCEILVFPYESAGYFIMYGYGMISLKEFIKYNCLKSILMIVSFVCVLYPLWNLFHLVFI